MLTTATEIPSPAASPFQTMVRKSKAEAQATRAQLLDAAEQVFLRQGVAATSLQQIAIEAGLTRGAIYWHFQDKADLFIAMMDRVTMPCECALEQALAATDEPRSALHRMALSPLQALTQDEQTRRVFRIAMHLTEYTGELAPVAVRHEEAIAEFVGQMQTLFERLLPAERSHAAALGLFALIDGLMRQWTARPEGFDLLAVGDACVGAYLSGLRAEPPAAPAPAPRKSPARPVPST